MFFTGYLILGRLIVISFAACAKRGDGWMVMYKYITGLEVTDESSVKNSIEWCEVSGDLTRSVELKVILNSASNSTI